jgi:formamidopyrimidine-DNA glycosylase
VPELPEVETIARELHSLVAGAGIVAVSVKRPDVLRRATARTFRNRLVGTSIVKCWRRAKTAVIDLSSEYRVCVQPRFTGALLVESPSNPLPPAERRYSTLYLTLNDGRNLHYVDVRRLGTVSLLNGTQFELFTKSLGPEPLAPGFTAEVFSGLLRGSTQAIKKFIMDQTRVVGVGNIYANEALWTAGVDPSKPAAALSPESAAKLHGAITSVLRQAIEARGTSFRDYRDASGEAGEFFSRLNAYGRAGKACKRCGKKLIGTHVIDGRATVFCASCQR